MTVWPRRIVPGRIAPAQPFCGVTPFSPSGGSTRSSEASDVPASARLLLPPRLIVPAPTTVKRSLWVFRAPKLELLED